MGDPKFPRRKYATPFHPWKADRIAEENAIQKKYGLKNKKEVWKAKSHLRAFRGRARILAAQIRAGNPQAELERKQLLNKLNKMGVLGPTATLDDVLAMNVEMLLARRLQTVLYLRGFTASTTQSRQFIAHGHVTIGGRRMNIPGYYVKRAEEEQINLNPNSALSDQAHPARPKRAEGAPAPKLKDYKPPEARGRPGQGGRGGGGFGRGPPRGGPGGPGRGPPRAGGAPSSGGSA